MKGLDLIKKNIVPIMVVLFVISLVYVGFQWGTNKQLKATAEIFEKDAKDTKQDFDEYKKDMDKRESEWEEDNTEKQKIIDAKEAENDELLRQREEDRERIESLEQRVEKASPEGLVSITRRILGTNEVWWNVQTERSEFTLAAFRISTFKHLDWEDFTLTREPNYKKQILNDSIVKIQLRGQIGNLTGQVGDVKVGMGKLQVSYDHLYEAFEAYKKATKNKGGFFNTAGKILIGFGIYAIVDNIWFRD